MSVNFGPGLHAAIGRAVDPSAYDRFIGRWGRLFVPAVLAAAEVATSHRLLDVATGTGDAASMALSQVESSGLVVGSDISVAMLEAATTRLADRRFWTVAADGQALPFADGSFDSVICQLGLQFSRIPHGAWKSSAAFSARAIVPRCASYPHPSARQCGGFWRKHSASIFPSSARCLSCHSRWRTLGISNGC